MKEVYVAAEMEVIVFENEDIITSSVELMFVEYEEDE